MQQSIELTIDPKPIHRELTLHEVIMKQKIEEMDLGPVRFKLIEENQWSLDQVNTVEVQYKMYLWLVMGLKVHVPPSKIIDEFWHTHIIDTRLYAFHCETVFGEFLHHFPYYGLRGYDLELVKTKFLNTVRLFEEYKHLFNAQGLLVRDNITNNPDWTSTAMCHCAACDPESGRDLYSVRPRA